MSSPVGASLRRVSNMRPVLRYAIAFGFAPLCAPVAHAQVEQTRPQAFHAIVVTTGATTMKVDALNGSLTGARFAGLSNDGISYGASGHYAHGRAMLGVDYARTTFGEEGLSNGRSDDLSAMQVVATVSYAILTAPRLSIYPTLGVGTGKFDVALRDRAGGASTTATDPTFAEVAANPGSATTISGRHLVYSVGGGADYLVTRSARDAFGIVLGIRAGMMLAPNRTTWTAGGRNVIAGPDASAGGPFLRIVVGVGGR